LHSAATASRDSGASGGEAVLAAICKDIQMIDNEDPTAAIDVIVNRLRRVATEDQKLLRQYVSARPGDVTARSILYITLSLDMSPDLDELYAVNNWLVINYPGSAALGVSMFGIQDYKSRKLHQQLEASWRKHLANDKLSAGALWNAGVFFEANPGAQIPILERGKSLEPKSIRWNYTIGIAYLLQAAASQNGARVMYARKSQDEFKTWFAAKEAESDNHHGIEYLYALDWSAKASYRADDADASDKYARRAIQIINRGAVDRYNYMIWHNCHTLLGSAALARGDNQKANEHLLASVTVPKDIRFLHHPALDLAQSIYQRDRRNTAIIQYLKMCEELNPARIERYRKLARSIEAGATISDQDWQ